MGVDSYNFDSEYSVEEIKLDIYVLIKCNHPNVAHYFSERGQPNYNIFCITFKHMEFPEFCLS